jgi:hypothetical protein
MLCHLRHNRFAAALHLNPIAQLALSCTLWLELASQQVFVLTHSPAACFTVA